MSLLAKRLLILFGVLDAVLLLRFMYLVQWPYWVFGHDYAAWVIALELTRIALILSFAASAYALIQRQKWGVKLTYAQFPFRLINVMLTFGLLTLIPGVEQIIGQRNVIYILMLLEVGRLVATIVIHKHTNKHNGWTRVQMQSQTPDS